MPTKEREIILFKSPEGRPDKVIITGRDGLEAEYHYDSNASLSKIKLSSKTQLDPLELLKAVNQTFIQRIGTIHQIEKLPQANIGDITEGFDFVERWEKGFDKNLYYGRTGSYFFSEAAIIDRDLWTAPQIIPGVNTVQESTAPFMPSPCMNALWMRNSIEGKKLDELYVTIPKAFFRARFRIDVKLPTAAQLGANDYVGFGFELNSQGGHCAPAYFIGHDGDYRLQSQNSPECGATSATPVVVAPNEGVWTQLLFFYDYPWTKLYEFFGGVWTLLGTLGPISPLAGGLCSVIPFMFNESGEIEDNFYVGNIAINRLDKVPISAAHTPNIYNVTLVAANTEYSQAFPANTKKFLIHTQDESAFRLAFVTGKVAAPTAPYLSILSGSRYFEDLVQLDGTPTSPPAAFTIYFAGATAGKIIEIIAWTG